MASNYLHKLMAHIIEDKNDLEHQLFSSSSHEIKVLERIANENVSNVASISLY